MPLAISLIFAIRRLSALLSLLGMHLAPTFSNSITSRIAVDVQNGSPVAVALKAMYSGEAPYADWIRASFYLVPMGESVEPILISESGNRPVHRLAESFGIRAGLLA